MIILEALSFVTILILAAVLISAAIGDWRHFIISNRTVVITFILFTVFISLQISSPINQRILADPINHLLTSLLIAAAVLIITTAFFALNIMGGGDVKLMTVIALWAGTSLILPFIFITSLVGGIVTVIAILRYKLNQQSTSHLLDPSGEASQIVNPLSSSMADVKVPYGLGICAGGLAVCYALITKSPALFQIMT